MQYSLVLLHSQLFGEGDPDEDVSPDSADPELRDAAASNNGSSGENGASSSTSVNGTSVPAANAAGNVERVSTRAWAQSHGYDPQVCCISVCCRISLSIKIIIIIARFLFGGFTDS